MIAGVKVRQALSRSSMWEVPPWFIVLHQLPHPQAHPHPEAHPHPQASKPVTSLQTSKTRVLQNFSDVWVPILSSFFRAPSSRATGHHSPPQRQPTPKPPSCFKVSALGHHRLSQATKASAKPPGLKALLRGLRSGDTGHHRQPQAATAGTKAPSLRASKTWAFSVLYDIQAAKVEYSECSVTDGRQEIPSPRSSLSHTSSWGGASVRQTVLNHTTM